MRTALFRLVAIAVVAAPVGGAAQSFRSADSVIRRMWQLGMDSSQTEQLAQVLLDSIGPRLSGTAGFTAAGDWLERTYRGWNVTARREPYGTWRGWRQGATHMDLTAPRIQTLDVELLAWSPGTNGRAVEADVVVVPAAADTAAASRWLTSVRGKFVLISPPEIMCRAPQELERYARPATVTALNERRAAIRREYGERLRALTQPGATLVARLEAAGAAGLGTLTWSGGWGVNKVFATPSNRVPSFDLSCEDYGLLYRLATNNQGPRVRFGVDAQSTTAEVPMFNIVAELRGAELPDEYVVLSAHLDSWHSATGATDNGTGTIMMLEAMRILKAAYPRPRRTILVGHWGGEEQGTIGSRSFAEDHPEVLRGMQALFNHDNGTWRIEYLEASGFLKAGSNLARWVAQLPGAFTDSLRFAAPGGQINMGSDHTSFICRPAPAFRLQSSYSEYRQYTWHTNRDTYDKIVFDDLRQNATIAAMMAYAASEDRERVPLDQALLPPGPDGQPRPWVRCGPAQRSFAQPAR